MGDLELLKNQHEVDCALTVLGYCYKFEALRVRRMFLFYIFILIIAIYILKPIRFLKKSL